MDVKLFTWEGLKVTVIHNLIILGMFFAVAYINVEFLGNDLKINTGMMSRKSN